MKKLLVVPVHVAALSMSLVVLIACEDEDVGIPCNIGGGSFDGGGQIRVNSQALDCRSRLCIFYPAATAQSMCTRICENEDDCPEAGEIETCEPGFSCVVGQTVGSLKCCKMCVCKKYLTGVDAGGAAAACAGFTPDCPELE